MRIDDALVWGEYTLVNSDSPLLDAQVLLAFVLIKPTIYLMTWPERELTAQQKADFEQLIEQRVNGRPIAHLTGEREFWSLPLKVNASTLIPRPDTEVLVELALAKSSNQAHILDLGTGTGAIILALASELPQATCLGVDFSTDAVALASENRDSLGFTQVSIKQSNWFDNVQGRFDVIVSNPPYIDPLDIHLKQGDVRFEPLSALTAEENGLADIRLICVQAKDYLRPGGCLLIEHGYDQAESVRQIMLDNDFEQVKTVKDYAKNDRVTLGHLSF